MWQDWESAGAGCRECEVKQEEDGIRIAECAEVWMRGDLGEVLHRIGVENGVIG